MTTSSRLAYHFCSKCLWIGTGLRVCYCEGGTAKADTRCDSLPDLIMILQRHHAQKLEGERSLLEELEATSGDMMEMVRVVRRRHPMFLKQAMDLIKACDRDPKNIVAQLLP